MFDFAVKENIKFNLDNLIPFAHWITPKMMPKRFDTYFYIAEAPKAVSYTHLTLPTTPYV